MVKPGIQTTELWAVLAAAVNAGTETLSSNPHTNYSILGSAVAYAALRTILKLVAGKSSGNA